MDDADRPMSQADIDAMLAAAQGSSGPAASAAAAPVPAAATSPFRATFSESDDSPAPAAPAAPAAPVAPVAPAAAPVAPAAPVVPDLAARLAKVEAALERLGQIEKTAADMGAVAEQVRKLGADLGQITEYLQGTIGYGARQTFQCGSCGTHGLVGTRISCTHCGQETWWGWFPQR